VFGQFQPIAGSNPLFRKSIRAGRTSMAIPEPLATTGDLRRLLACSAVGRNVLRRAQLLVTCPAPANESIPIEGSRAKIGV